MYTIECMKVLVVGSSLFDAIISVEDNPHITVTDKNATFSLGDKIPIDIKAFSIGGNGPNVASSLQKLSISNSLYTYLGDDALSSYIKHQLENEGITVCSETTNVSTGPLSLIFNFKDDRTIFSFHPEFEHGFDANKLLEKPTHIYLTSIGKTWEKAYEGVLSYAEKENIPIAFSPGSQQMKDMNGVFTKTIHQAKMLFCNMEEAKNIHKTVSGNELDDQKHLLLDLKKYGFELLSVTDGENGAYAVDNNNTVYKIPSVDTDGHEKTGAGDAYAGAFLASYLENLPVQECMKRGTLNALGVMSHVGAHTGQLKKEEMDEKVWQTDLNATVI